MLTTAVIAGVVTMFATGIGSALTKRPAVELGAIETVVLRNLIAVPILVVVYFAIGEPVDFSGGSLIAALLIAVSGYFPFMFFMLGLERGKVGVVMPVASGRVLVSALFGFLILGEAVTAGKLLAFALVTAGIFAGSINWKEFRNSNLFDPRSGVPFALLAAFLWGIILPLFKFPSEWYGAIFWALVIETFVLLGGLIHLIALKRRPLIAAGAHTALRKNALFIFGAAVMTTIFTTFTNIGYETGEIAIVTALSGAGVVVAILASALLYRERLSRFEYLGAGLVVLGILAASII